MDNPLVSVVTPSFNQGRYIRETIESVLNQDYPLVELIVVDGGSTDGTLEILNSFAQLGTQRFRFVSEPDRGQAHALNKGFDMASGAIAGWLNSDDTYNPGAISKAVQALEQHPDWAMVYGRANYVNERSEILYPYDTKPFDHNLLLRECFICQPGAFLKRDVVIELGGVNESYQFCMDYELWMRIAESYSIGFIEDCLANSRLHDACKSMLIWKDIGLLEVFRLSLTNRGSIAGRWLAEYAHHHWDKGVFWLLNRYKTHKVFGSSPELVSIERYDDGWVPNVTNLLIKNDDPGKPVHSFLIKGRHHLPHLMRKLHLTVFIDHHFMGVYEVQPHSFVLEFPVHRNSPFTRITLHTHEVIVPAHHGVGADYRALGFVAEEVIPVTEKEYQFYTTFRQNPGGVIQWLLQGM